MNLLEELKNLNNLNKLNNNTVLKITCLDSQVCKGTYYGYTSALDNEPEIAEIEIRDLETGSIICILENEIKSIDVI